MVKVIELTGTTTAGGALTVTSTQVVTGYIEKVLMDYVDGDTGADITLTIEGGGVSQDVLTITNAGTSDLKIYPRKAIVDTANAAFAVPFGNKLFMAGETLKMVVAQGGATKVIRVLVYIADGG